MALIRHPKDFGAGVLFATLGATAIFISSSYPLGTAARMGPGYFPRMLGILLLALAAILILRSYFLRGPAPAMRNLKPLVILISSSADREFRWKEAVVSSLILAAFTVGVFIYGLGLQLPIWPPFLVPR